MTRPIARFRAGSISCALWENEIRVNGTTKTVLKASVSRRYKDKDGNWKSSQSFARDEIPVAVYCLGTHNGWIANADRLVKALGLPRIAEVDSEVLFRLVDRSRDALELKALLARCRGRISAAFVRLGKPGRLRLLKGDMPLSAAHVPRLRAVFYASEAWMLRAALDGQRCHMLEFDPFTLSTFDVRNVLDLTQHDVFFRSPEITPCPAK